MIAATGWRQIQYIIEMRVERTDKFVIIISDSMNTNRKGRCCRIKRAGFENTGQGKHMNIICRSTTENDALQMVSMSEDWEAEQCTYGFHANKLEYIKENRSWVALADGELAGYIMGKMNFSKRMQSIMPDGTPYFEVEELYVKPAYRNQSVGSTLMNYLEDLLKKENITKMVLSTAAKEYESILNFYIKRQGMSFWSARLFKEL